MLELNSLLYINLCLVAYIALDQKQTPAAVGEQYFETVRGYFDGLQPLPEEFTLDNQQTHIGLYDVITPDDDGLQPQLNLIACLELVPGDSRLEEGSFALAFQIPLPNVIGMDGQPQTITTSFIPVREGEEIAALKQASDGNALLYRYGVIESVIYSNDPEAFPSVIIRLNQEETQPEVVYLEAA